MDQTLFSLVSFVVAYAVSVLDGRHAVSWSAFLVIVALEGTISSSAGVEFGILLFVFALIVLFADRLAFALGKRFPHDATRDPLRELRSTSNDLFGPRSQRVIAATIAVPAASWVSFNIPVGTLATLEGALFPPICLWLIGVFRIMMARNTGDLSVGAGILLIATSVGWLVRSTQLGGPEVLPLFLAVLLIAFISGFGNGRFVGAKLQGTPHAA